MVEEEGPLGSVPQTTFPAHIIERAIIGHHQVKSTPKVGKRSREWIAVGATEVECVREMARCLVELGEGRWPK